MINKRLGLLLAIPLLIGLALSIWVSSGAGALPMDDAYILRQYAVNLANGNGWGFNSGEISFGTTSLLWPVIISGPMAIFSSLTYENISYFLGILSFTGLIFLVQWWVLQESKSLFLSLIAGALMAVSPAGYMNAVSGMESMFFATAMIGVLAIYRFSGMKRPVLLGLLSGMIFLIRPEGLFLALAVPGAEIIGDLRGKTVAYKKYLHFAAGFVILAAPYVIFVRLNTPGWLPTTYAGKIISSDPFMHRSGILYDFMAGLGMLFKGHWRILARFGIVAPLIWSVAAGYSIIVLAAIYKKGTPTVNRKAAITFIVAFAAIFSVYVLSLNERMKIAMAASLLIGVIAMAAMLIGFTREKSGNDDLNAVEQYARTLPVLGILLIPFVYGAVFRVEPLFGGYYERYILAILPAFIILSISGIGWITERVELLKGKAAPAICLVLLLIYPFFHAIQYLPDHKDVYGAEARANSGGRMRAALWIKNNTPRDAVVFIGYTGLGVVGGFSERYVLDMGALINPDIFPYYHDVPNVGEERWARTVQYIKDRGVDYFVTTPDVVDDPSSDPTGRAGFMKVAVIEDPGLPGHISTIEIWNIDRDKLDIDGKNGEF